jgi:hypothetical protein
MANDQLPVIRPLDFDPSELAVSGLVAGNIGQAVLTSQLFVYELEGIIQLFS